MNLEGRLLGKHKDDKTSRGKKLIKIEYLDRHL